MKNSPSSLYHSNFTSLTFPHQRIDNSAAQVIQLRPPELNSGSVNSLNVATDFLKVCHDQHDGCHVEEFPLPSRVLDTDLPDEMVKLIEPQGQSGEYACLSYCVCVSDSS